MSGLVSADSVTSASGSIMVLVSFSSNSTSDSVRFSGFVPLLSSVIFSLRASGCSLPSDSSDICLYFSEIGLLGDRLSTFHHFLDLNFPPFSCMRSGWFSARSCLFSFNSLFFMTTICLSLSSSLPVALVSPDLIDVPKFSGFPHC